MIKQSELYKKLIRRPGRKQYVKADVTLRSGTVLQLGNKDIAEGGLEISSATSQQGVFMPGAAVIGELNLTLINHEKQFENYDFTNAVLRPYAGLLTGQKWDGTQTIEWVPLGVFTVDEAVKTNSTVTITALDVMAKFDRPYSESVLAYPATLGQIVEDTCKVCGVTLATPDFYGKGHVVASRPITDSITCREIIGYAAALCGCFAHCNRSGALEITWYDLMKEPYVPAGVQSTDVAAADITVTGVEIVPDNADHVFSGTNGYIVKIEQNPLAQDNLQLLADSIGARLKGFTFRPYTISALSDPTVELGDTARVTDRHGTEHISFVSNLSYSIDGMQTLTADAETQAKNQSIRFTQAQKNTEKIQQVDKKHEEAESNITQEFKAADGELKSTIENTAKNLSTAIEQNESQIELRAKKDELISLINISPEGVKIAGDKVDIESSVFRISYRNDPSYYMEVTKRGSGFGIQLYQNGEQISDGSLEIVGGALPGVFIWGANGSSVFVGGNSHGSQIIVTADSVQFDGNLNLRNHKITNCSNWPSGGNANMKNIGRIELSKSGNLYVYDSDGDEHVFYES